jgi:hypothetical protein
MGKLALLAAVATCACATVRPGSGVSPAAASGGGTRRTSGTFVVVRLTGTPEQIGYQHGRLLADEIQRAIDRTRQETGSRPWSFYRQAAERIFWPRVPEPLRAELRGMAAGLRARGGKLDMWDLVAHNAAHEITNGYLPWLEHRRREAAREKSAAQPPATGIAMGGDKPVLARIEVGIPAHEPVVLEVSLASRAHFVMLTGAGELAPSELAINGAGLAFVCVPIPGFHGFDPLGIPLFVRARRAIEESATLDSALALLRDRPNGGNATDWLISASASSEVARLESGLRHQQMTRSRDQALVTGPSEKEPALASEELALRPPPEPNPGAQRRFFSSVISALHEDRGSMRTLVCARPGGEFDLVMTDPTLAGRLGFYALRGPCTPGGWQVLP